MVTLAEAAAVGGVITALLAVLGLAVRLGRLLEQKNSTEQQLDANTEALNRVDETLGQISQQQATNATAMARLAARVETQGEAQDEQYIALYEALRDVEGIQPSEDLPTPERYPPINISFGSVDEDGEQSGSE